MRERLWRVITRDPKGRTRTTWTRRATHATRSAAAAENRGWEVVSKQGGYWTPDEEVRSTVEVLTDAAIDPQVIAKRLLALKGVGHD